MSFFKKTYQTLPKQKRQPPKGLPQICFDKNYQFFSAIGVTET